MTEKPVAAAEKKDNSEGLGVKSKRGRTPLKKDKKEVSVQSPERKKSSDGNTSAMKAKDSPKSTKKGKQEKE